MTKVLQDVNVGIGLARARNRSGLTQEAACARMAQHGRPMLQSHLANIEAGRRNIYASDLIAFSRVYGASIDEFFAGLEPVSRYQSEKDQPPG